MPKIFNKDSVEYQINQKRCADFSWMSAGNLAKLVNAKHLNFSIRCLNSDKFSYPYHYHHNAEEMFVILSGKAQLRTTTGITEISQGDIVFFEMGETSAHQLYNHSDESCVFLDICTNMGFDLCEYPDSGKMANLSTKQVLQNGKEVDYFKDEDKVREIWSNLKS
ncbi:cupin domain-containing protein [Clostridium sp. 'deep sea']|uniref:cupin domain-containing protein n=1 Tax=Clostridium sp. 'deep sea' TaxID=2779445 RepID=UPI0018969CD4|nr:cupin domain-containing protein [Clostridium sp. 'deep sea']QOR34963.1 cupin domain-containing protein [Clostridium sp. 'deep sea']